MRKLFFALLALVAVAGVVWADATFTSTLTPKSGKLDFMSGGAVAVTDQNTGYTQRVDSDGNAATLLKGQTLYSADGNTLSAGVTAYTGACRVSSITCGGIATSAGDYYLVYDNTSATGEPKYECSVGTAKDTNTISIPGGAIFSTGIFLDSNVGSVHAAVTYDY